MKGVITSHNKNYWNKELKVYFPWTHMHGYMHTSSEKFQCPDGRTEFWFVPELLLSVKGTFFVCLCRFYKHTADTGLHENLA